MRLLCKNNNFSKIHVTNITIYLNCNLHIFYENYYVKIDENLKRNVGKEMNLKNLIKYCSSYTIYLFSRINLPS